MARRGHGEGSITRRKDGRYQAAITLENHKRKYFYGETRKEVQDKLNLALYEQKQGMLATGPQQTLQVFFEKWLEQVCRLTKKPNTYKTYRSAARAHIIPALGHIKLQKLTIEQLQAFFAEKQKRLKPASLSCIRKALKSALNDAVMRGLVARNVATFVSLPNIERYEGQVLTEEQARKLLDVAHSSHLDVMLLVALTTGMRQGELLALRWSDVDLETGVLQVRRNVTIVNGVGPVETEPKTKAGRRKVMLPGVVIKALRGQQEQQAKMRLALSAKWHDLGLIFPTMQHNSKRPGDFLRASNVRASFKRLLKLAGLPDVRFHDLRHSVATILFAAGIDLKVISELLGHSSIAVTSDVYAHLLPDKQHEVANKMDDLFGSS
ncbi:MAG TPA: site-specific integrase [Ktedonobacteraceae bacterium]|nr:site-specific integrase [Ktedonobacteraceae bacterium]